MTKYEQRITIFIDILGFRNIVKKTEFDEDYTNKIFEVLDSIKTELLSNEIFGEINIDSSNKEMFEEVKTLRDIMSKSLMSKSSIIITQFSDSIVFSIGLENDMNAMSLFEYIGRIIYRLWRDFKILIRGGVSVDKLIHREDGVLFGPAMVNAYDYETNLANFPRIVFDDFSYNIFRNSPSFKGMQKLIKPFSDNKVVNGKTIEIKNGFEINLGTSILHLLESHFTFHPDKRKEVFAILNNMNAELNALKDQTSKENIKEKYQYLINEINQITFPKI